MSQITHSAANPLDRRPLPPKSYRCEALVALASVIIIAVGLILKQHCPGFMTQGRWTACWITGCTLFTLSFLFGLDRYCHRVASPPAPKGRPLAEMMREFYRESSTVTVDAQGSIALNNDSSYDQMSLLKDARFRDLAHFKLFIETLTSLARKQGAEYSPSRFTLRSGKMLFEHALEKACEHSVPAADATEYLKIAETLIAQCDGTQERVKAYFLMPQGPSLEARLQISAKLKPSPSNPSENQSFIDLANSLITNACTTEAGLQIEHLNILENMVKNGFQFRDTTNKTHAVITEYVKEHPAQFNCLVKYFELQGKAIEDIGIDLDYGLAVQDDSNLPILKRFYKGADKGQLTRLARWCLPIAISHRSVQTVQWITTTCTIESQLATTEFFKLFDELVNNANQDDPRARGILKALAPMITKTEFEEGMGAASRNGADLYPVLAQELADSFKKPSAA